MSEDYDEGAELFNDDFDDSETTMATGVKRRVCPTCSKALDYRVEGRFVVRYCKACGHEEED